MGKNKKSKSCSTKYDLLPPFISNLSLHYHGGNVNNGLYLNNKYMPEEIILHILSFIEPTRLLSCCLVCRKWNKLIKSYTLWSMIYTRKYNCKTKKLPWYLYCCLLSTNYFDTNLLINGNGQEGLNNWECKIWDGDKYVEDSPVAADPLPADIPEFNNQTSCFTTTYFSGYKIQLIKLGRSKLFRYILDNYKPHIYLSEWTTGRNDCGCIYKLQCGFIGQSLVGIPVTKPYVTYHKPQWSEAKWEKMELLVTEYPEGIEGISFENEGHNTQTWKKHYGSKMAGGMVKFIFDSIEPLPLDEHGNIKPKIFSAVQFTANGLSQENVIDYCSERYLWNEGEDEEKYYFMLP